MARTLKSTQEDHVTSLCAAAAPCATPSTAAADEQDILSLLLHNSSITWPCQAACKLLCTSKAMHAAVTQHLYGSLAVSKSCKGFDECKLFCMWLRKYANLLHTLHVDLPRHREEIKIEHEEPRCANCSGFDEDDMQFDIVCMDADIGLSAVLFLTAPPAVPPATTCCCQQPADGGNRKDSDSSSVSVDDSDTEECPICRGFELPRRSRLPLRAFSTNTPCAKVLSVLPASLESLEMSFSPDDLRWSEVVEQRLYVEGIEYATPVAIGTALLGLHSLQRLTLHIQDGLNKLSHNAAALDHAVPGVATYRGIGPAADQFPGLKHLSVMQLENKSCLQLLPVQLTSLDVGFSGVPKRNRDRPRLFEILGLPHLQPPLDALEADPNQPAFSLGRFTAMQQLAIRDVDAGNVNRAARPSSWQMLQHDDVLPPKLAALKLSYGGALQPLQALHHLTHINIEHCTMNEEQLPSLNSLVSLQHLRLAFGSASSTLAAGEACSKLAALKELGLELAGPRRLDRDCSYGTWPAGAQQVQLNCDTRLSGLGGVTRLELSGLSASSERMQQMFGGGQLRQLRELRLVGFKPEDEQGVLRIGHLQALTQLSRLELAGTNAMSETLLLQVPAQLPGLKAFVVSS